MRLTVGAKFSVLIVGVIGLAFASTLGALLSAWRFRDAMRGIARENLPSVRAAEELEIALVEQLGKVASYILDGGNREWLERLRRPKAEMEHWLAQARATAHTSQERAILDDLESVYRKCDAQRDEVIALFDAGHKERAKLLLMTEMRNLQDRAYALCEDFIDANQRYVDTAVTSGERQVARWSLVVTVLLGLTLALGAALLWLFFQGVLLPLRRMAADPAGFASTSGGGASGVPDDLRAVGLYLQALMSDVADARTALATTRTRLRTAEKLASVGKLAASVAHEIRNPLTSIKMWLYSVEKSVGADAGVRRKLHLIAEEIARLESVVRSFLEFSRPPALNLQPHSVSSLIDKALELTSARMDERMTRIVREDGAGLPRVAADADQLKQVLINLVQNASEATAQGGTIWISSSAETDADGRRMVVVRVRDDGPGMAEEVRQRLFEPFFTTKDEGVGLGLCIAARIMAGHRGRLALESSSSRGTSFAVWIPQSEDQPHG